MFKQRSSKLELLDTLELDLDSLVQNLNEFTHINKWLGTNYVLKNAFNKVYRKYKPTKMAIVDIGCGGGDLARVLHRWAVSKKIKFEITGVDINAAIVKFATQQTTGLNNLRFQNADVFSEEFSGKKFDVACLNNVCHHFEDAKLIILLKSLQKQIKTAIIINDLQRNPCAYFGFLAISKLFNLSYLAKHDGPLSILRSFTRRELEKLIIAAGVKKFEIKWKWAFRWQVIIWCEEI